MLGLVAAATADEQKPAWQAPEFIEARIRANASAADRAIMEEFLSRRRESYDALLAAAKSIEEQLQKVRQGKVVANRQPSSAPAPGKSGDSTSISEAQKASAVRQKERSLAATRKRIKLYAQRPAVVMPFSDGPAIGTIGRFATPVHVIQVATEIDVLVDASGLGLAWIEGIDAREVAEHQALTIHWPFLIAGTRSYTNAFGQTRSVPLLRRFNPAEYLE